MKINDSISFVYDKFIFYVKRNEMLHKSNGQNGSNHDINFA